VSDATTGIATAASLAEQVRDLSSDEDRLRCCVGWFSEVGAIDDPVVASSLVADLPPSTGDRRFDALIGGLVEHLGCLGALSVPAWVHDGDRFLEVFWFPVDLPSLRVTGLRDAPAALARRCVFLDRRELARV